MFKCVQVVTGRSDTKADCLGALRYLVADIGYFSGGGGGNILNELTGYDDVTPEV